MKIRVVERQPFVIEDPKDDEGELVEINTPFGPFYIEKKK